MDNVLPYKCQPFADVGIVHTRYVQSRDNPIEMLGRQTRIFYEETIYWKLGE
jgi:hypothetical protein